MTVTKLTNCFMRIKINFAYFRIVIAWLFIHASAALHCSPAYLFATDSASVPSDSGDSWVDYILLHLSNRFTTYALRLTEILQSAFALGLRHDPLPRFILHL